MLLGIGLDETLVGYMCVKAHILDGAALGLPVHSATCVTSMTGRFELLLAI